MEQIEQIQLVKVAINQLFSAQSSIQQSKYDAMKARALKNGRLSAQWVQSWGEPIVLQRITGTNNFLIINGHTRLSAIYNTIFEENPDMSLHDWLRHEIEIPVELMKDEALASTSQHLINLEGIGVIRG